MKKTTFSNVSKSISLVILLLVFNNLLAQNQDNSIRSKSDFWQNVQFGGGIGLNIGSGFTDISLAPSAIYNVNEYVSLGLGAQYSYINQKNNFTRNLYGGSVVALFNPIREVQLSAELEQLRVNTTLVGGVKPDAFWNTGLFLGAGYRNGNVTIGGKYNVLYNDNNNVYNSAFMPFVRVYF